MPSLTLVKRAEGNEGYKLRLSVSPEVLLKRNTSKKCQNVTELNATLTPQRERKRKAGMNDAQPPAEEQWGC